MESELEYLIERREIRTSHGLIEIERHGSGGSPVCIICNSIGQSAKSWHRYLPELLKNFDVILWDYGITQDETGLGYGHECFVGQLSELVECYIPGTRKVHLLGVCFGASVAFEYAARYKNKVSSMVLTGLLTTKEESCIARQNSLSNLYHSAHRDILVEMLFFTMFGNKMLRELSSSLYGRNRVMRERMREAMNDRFPILMKCQSEYLLQKGSFSASAEKEVIAPTLLIIGEDDVVTLPNHQRKSIDKFLEIKCIEYSGVGHLVHIEEGERFINHAVDFMHQCDVGSVA